MEYSTLASIASMDWTVHILGPRASWSPALRTNVSTILALPSAAFMVWGPDRTFFFNDAYIPILGPRVPHAMGARLEELWPDAWLSIVEDFDRAMAGESISYADRYVPLARYGSPEDTWWTFSFSPLFSDDGVVAGVLCLTNEVTDAVRARAAAVLDQRRLRAAINLARLGTYTWDLASGSVTMDARSREMWGFDPEEVIDQHRVFDRIDPEALESVQKEVPSSIATHDALLVEYSITLPGGTTRRVVSGGEIVCDRQDNPAQIVGTFDDVTDERAGQRALEEANEALADELAEQNAARERAWRYTPDLLSILDLETGKFERLNPSWTTTLGWDTSEMEGRAYVDFLHPDDLAASQAAFDVVRRGEPVLQLENRYRTKDGTWRWMSWVAYPQGDKLYSSSRDVTETHEQAIKLAERTRERDRLWRNTQDLQVVIDENGIFQAVNPAFTAVLGWVPEEVIGRPVFDFIVPEDQAITNDALRHARSKSLPTTENRYRHKEGGFRWISWLATPDAGLIYASGRNITAEKEHAQALEAIAETLRQSQKMEAVGQLTGGLAHDFNNLLAGMLGNLELLQMRVARGRIDDLDRFINAAQGAGRRAASLTQRLLAFSRRQTLDPRPTDVNRLIAELQELLHRTVGSSKTLSSTYA
jgi:PAS domain S-box-containing protein